MKILGSHTETIECPECGEVQTAIVEQTVIWNSYVHECQKCKYIILESEWNKVEQNDIQH